MKVTLNLATRTVDTSPQTPAPRNTAPALTLARLADRTVSTPTGNPPGHPWRLAPTAEYLRAVREADLAVRKAVLRRVSLRNPVRQLAA